MYIALYARQSIERDNSISIETQLQYCNGMIRPDEKLYDVKNFSDKGYSGKDTNRPDFQRLMKDIHRGKVKKVIVYKLDRVSRSLIDFVDMLAVFKKYNVEFISSQECFDTSSPYGEMICKLLMIFAEFERTSIINRIRDAYDKRSDMGLYSGGRRVYGYNLEDTVINGIKTKKFVINKKEAEHIKYIFEVYSQPSVTLRLLQNNLLENGIKPLYGVDWTTGKLGTLLRNPIYVKADVDIYDYFERNNTNIVGNIEDFNGKHNIQLYGKTTHDKKLTDWSDMKIVLLQSHGIVDSAIWLKCQRKLEQNKQIGNSLSNNTSWLSGKLVCAKCGHTMTTVKGETRKYFLCTGKTHKKTCTGVKQTIYVEDMEEMIDEYISNKLESLNLSKVHHSDENSAQINIIKLKVKEVEQKLSSLSDAILSGSLNEEMIAVLNERAKKLTEEKRKYLNDIDDLLISSSNVKESLNFSKKWNKADFKERKAICNVLIKSIVIDGLGNAEILWNI
ncbi:MAG: recombinase family protein [Clostridia bacterium]|nr:recombinase family protein [Clostridia bacterium]